MVPAQWHSPDALSCVSPKLRQVLEVQSLVSTASASVPEEQARVEAAGGTVLFGSLEGMLELSRGLGDFDFCRGGFSQELDLL